MTNLFQQIRDKKHAKQTVDWAEKEIQRIQKLPDNEKPQALTDALQELLQRIREGGEEK